jgi:hypothetical protein
MSHLPSWSRRRVLQGGIAFSAMLSGSRMRPRQLAIAYMQGAGRHHGAVLDDLRCRCAGRVQDMAALSELLSPV